MKKKTKKKLEGTESQSGSKKIKKGIRKKRAGKSKKEKKYSAKKKKEEKIFISADGKLKLRFVAT